MRIPAFPQDLRSTENHPWVLRSGFPEVWQLRRLWAPHVEEGWLSRVTIDVSGSFGSLFGHYLVRRTSKYDPPQGLQEVTMASTLFNRFQ